jgi:glycerol uptake facilitator-like aquaporin
MSAEKQELIAEFLGSLFLTTAAITPMILFPNILGSGIGIAVIADAVAVGFVLSVLIEMFGPISYAHFNPLVSLMVAYLKRISFTKAFEYIIAQLLGGLTGLFISHLMFFHKIPVLIEISNVNRGGGNYLAEIIGTTILLLAILILDKNGNPRIGWNIGILVGGQLLATSSTMFANPMITIMRTLTYSAAGIRPIDSLAFIVMQSIGLIITLNIWNQFNGDAIK